MKDFAVPVAAGIMEAQPVVLIFLFASLLFTGKSNALLLLEGSIILLIWSLYWWAMLAKLVIQPRKGEERANLVYFAALFVTFAIIVTIHPTFFDEPISILFPIALSLWLWRRGMSRVEKTTQGEPLIAAFQVGFFALLVILIFAVVDPQPTYKVLLGVLTYALPIYCASGIVALSLSHLDAIRRAHVRRAAGTSRANPTRTWITMLLSLSLAIATLVTTLIVSAFQPLVTVFSPLADALREFISWLLKLLSHTPVRPPPHRGQLVPGDVPIPPYHPVQNPFSAILQVILVVSMILLAMFLLVMLIWFVRRMLRKLKRSQDEDEIREQLSIRAALRARRQKREKGSGIVLEPLDASSARAHYREFLQAMVRHGGDERRRRADETPIEYQTRLLTLVKHVPHEQGQKDDAPADAAILSELTRAYTLERYGGKHTEQSQQAYLRRWVSLLVKRLTASKRL